MNCEFQNWYSSKYPRCVKCTHTCDKRKCDKYNDALRAQLVYALQPLKMVSDVSVDFNDGKYRSITNAVYSRNIDKAKTAAVRMLNKTNHSSPIIKFSINQVYDFVMSGLEDELLNKIIYVEISSKQVSDLDKASIILRSFIDKMALRNTYVSIYLSPSSGIMMDKEVPMV